MMETARRLMLAFVGFVFILAALWVPASIYSCHYRHQGQLQEATRSEAEKKAIVHGETGQSQLALADAIRSARAPLDQKIKELEWKLKKGQSASAEPKPERPSVQPDILPEAIQERDALLQGYREKVSSLEAENASLRVSVAEFKAQAEDYRRGMVAAQLASEAQKAAAKSARMTGRVEGFGFGALAGWGFKSIAVKFRF